MINLRDTKEGGKMAYRTIAIEEKAFKRLEILAKKGHRPKTMQVELLIDFYVEQHPGALRVEEPLYDEE